MPVVTVNNRHIGKSGLVFIGCRLLSAPGQNRDQGDKRADTPCDEKQGAAVAGYQNGGGAVGTADDAHGAAENGDGHFTSALPGGQCPAAGRPAAQMPQYASCFAFS